MSLQSQAQLAMDPKFQQRVQASATEQANIFKDDGRADFVSLSKTVLRSPMSVLPTFWNMIAAAPGFDLTVDLGNDTIDSSKVADEEILSAIQASWPTIAGLYYDSEGNPI